MISEITETQILPVTDWRFAALRSIENSLHCTVDGDLGENVLTKAPVLLSCQILAGIAHKQR